ncbi:myb family transcription factor PHL5-like isoform X2 [Alnus glutinosa]|uniref:myb family transcription factor PHL5-like isoform X2 n=1 Tax=Alnus glutinosa TaxID=3517 RepID=UPI002D793908|nr:myb family transcription factor PHL5-like isoform X2 [Alnus glutinosa]
MNTQKIDCREPVNQNYGVIINDCSSEFANRSSQLIGFRQPWQMGTCVPMEGGSQQQYNVPAKSSTTIMSRFESPASAFYATERCMGFPQYECQDGNTSLSSQFSRTYDSQLPSYQSSGEDFSTDSANQAGYNFDLRNTLQAIVKSQFSSNQYYGSSEKSNKISCSNSSGCKLLPHEQNKLPGDDTIYGGGHLSIPFKGNQDHMLPQLSFSSQQEKQSTRFSSESVSVTSGNSASTSAVLSSKTRIRWTQDLHEKFVECVSRLGGAEKATPKAILKLMDSDGLTIFHVKSHLQKYRIAKYMPDSTEGKLEKRNSMNNVAQLDVKTGLQIREALQVQLDVQRRLHEQLEVQRNLQLRIEEQGKQLKMMFDQQQKTTSGLFKNHKLDTSSAEASVSLKDVQVSTSEGYGNSHFPSKIS